MSTNTVSAGVRMLAGVRIRYAKGGTYTVCRGCSYNCRGSNRVYHARSADTGCPGRYRRKTPLWGSCWEYVRSCIVTVVPSECEAAPRGAGGLDEGRVATAGTSVATAALVAVKS